MAEPIPHEVLQAATDVLWAGPDFNRKEPELRAKEVLEVAAPALRKQGAEEERQRLAEAMEALVKRQEMNSQDAGYVVATASIEAFIEFELEADHG